MKAAAIVERKAQKMWPTVRFRIEEFPDPDIVCVKHQIDDDDECKGKVYGGRCTKCYEYTDGVTVYSMKVLAADEKDDKMTLPIQFSHKGGKSLFMRSATNVGLLSFPEQGDEKELVTGIVLAAKMIVTYSPADEDFFVCAFDVVKV